MNDNINNEDPPNLRPEDADDVEDDAAAREREEEEEEQRREEERRRAEADDEDGADVPPIDFDGLLNRRPDAARSAEEGLRGSKLEWLENEVSDEAVKANSILVPKNRRGEFGSRDYLRNLDAATAALEPKLGVPSHFVSSRDRGTEAGNQTKHQYI